MSLVNRRILLIDDNPAIHEDFRKILLPARSASDLDALEADLFGAAEPAAPSIDFELTSVYQGDEGLQKVCESLEADAPFAMAFVDMRMPPGWDGVETIERLWQRDPRLQIVICTAYSDHSWEEVLKRLDVGDRLLILKKPFDNIEVFQLACALTAKWEMTQQAALKMSALEAAVQERTREILATNQELQAEITIRKAFEEQITHQAFHDALTGLPNRALFLNRLELAWSRAQHTHGHIAVIFVDLDNFKTINDSLGHQEGDQLLLTLAERLMKCVRVGDTVARLGGDEFILLLEQIPQVEDAIQVAERIIEMLHVPILIHNQKVFASASIGISYATDMSGQPEDLLRHADTAMYEAKASGKATYSLFDASMNDRVIEHMEIETGLRSALDRREFYLLYQPLIELETGHLSGAEALLRWKHPTRGLIPPGKFISIAEESGLIVSIGYWVLEEACRQAREWIEAYPNLGPFSINVNFSGKQLQRADAVERVRAILAKTGLPPAMLKLEITESVMMVDLDHTLAKLHQLKELGIKLAMDDFGTGYSSMANLNLFPLDTIKLDRAFINRLDDKGASASVVEAIIMLSRALHMDVTGEGIETQEQLHRLIALGCATGQGFYFARPLSVDALRDAMSAGPGASFPVFDPSAKREALPERLAA